VVINPGWGLEKFDVKPFR